MNEKKITILGLPGSGKTTFLSVLNLGLTLNLSPWRLRPTGQSSNTIAEINEIFFGGGMFPPKTNEITGFDFIAEKEAQNPGLIPGANFKIIVSDIPGEATEGKVSENSIYHDFYSGLMRESSGIIFLIDPEENWLKTVKSEENKHAYYFSLFSNFFTEMQEDIIETPMAFCITKADTIVITSDDFSRSIPSERTEYIAENILGKGAKSLIDHAIHPDYLLWTLVSSIGLENKKVARNSLGYEINKISNPENIKPIGVAETLEWLLNKIVQNEERLRKIIETRVAQERIVIEKIRLEEEKLVKEKAEKERLETERLVKEKEELKRMEEMLKLSKKKK